MLDYKNNKHYKTRKYKGYTLKVLVYSIFIMILMFLGSVIFSITKSGYLALHSHYIILPNHVTSYKEAISELKEIVEEYAFIDKKININDVYWLIDGHYFDKHKGATNKLEVNNNINLLLKYNIHSKTLTDSRVHLINYLRSSSLIQKSYTLDFFRNNDSSNSQYAGIYSALITTIYVIAIAMSIGLVLGFFGALYLEFFCTNKDSKLISFIEVNINNMVAIPSIIYGLFGVLIFQEFLHIPRGSALLGGLILGVMIMPHLLIYSRIAIKSVPQDIINAAYGLGMSKLQVIIYSVIPSSISGVLTGCILSVARVLSETAPLVMIGMTAFITNSALSIYSPATTLSTQILLWANMPTQGFVEKTSLAILVLICLLVILNIISGFIKYIVERGK